MKAYWILVCLLISACQIPGPSADFDPNRDYSRYQSWQWHSTPFVYEATLSNALTESRIQEAIEQRLTAQGLVQQNPAALIVQVGLSEKTYQEQLITQVGAHLGNMGLYQTRNLEYPVLVIRVDLFEHKRLIWRHSAELLIDDKAHPSKRQAQIQQAINQILSQYPPR